MRDEEKLEETNKSFLSLANLCWSSAPGNLPGIYFPLLSRITGKVGPTRRKGQIIHVGLLSCSDWQCGYALGRWPDNLL